MTVLDGDGNPLTTVGGAAAADVGPCGAYGLHTSFEDISDRLPSSAPGPDGLLNVCWSGSRKSEDGAAREPKAPQPLPL